MIREATEKERAYIVRTKVKIILELWLICLIFLGPCIPVLLFDEDIPLGGKIYCVAMILIMVVVFIRGLFHLVRTFRIPYYVIKATVMRKYLTSGYESIQHRYINIRLSNGKYVSKISLDHKFYTSIEEKDKLLYVVEPDKNGEIIVKKPEKKITIGNPLLIPPAHCEIL